MRYKMVQIPLAKQTFDSTKQELRSYFEWHQRVLPERIAQLQRLVAEWSPAGAWVADRSRESLRPLGAWMAAHLDFAPIPESELSRQRALLPPGSPIELHEPTMQMRSIAYDIGMYFGTCMITAYPTLSWQLVLGSKRHIEYGHVVVGGFSAGPLNTARVMLVCASKLLDGRTSPSCLHDLFGVWAKFVTA